MAHTPELLALARTVLAIADPGNLTRTERDRVMQQAAATRSKEANNPEHAARVLINLLTDAPIHWSSLWAAMQEQAAIILAPAHIGRAIAYATQNETFQTEIAELHGKMAETLATVRKLEHTRGMLQSIALRALALLRKPLGTTERYALHGALNAYEVNQGDRDEEGKNEVRRALWAALDGGRKDAEEEIAARVLSAVESATATADRARVLAEEEAARQHENATHWQQQAAILRTRAEVAEEAQRKERADRPSAIHLARLAELQLAAQGTTATEPATITAEDAATIMDTIATANRRKDEEYHTRREQAADHLARHDAARLTSEADRLVAAINREAEIARAHLERIAEMATQANAIPTLIAAVTNRAYATNAQRDRHEGANAPIAPSHFPPADRHTRPMPAQYDALAKAVASATDTTGRTDGKPNAHTIAALRPLAEAANNRCYADGYPVTRFQLARWIVTSDANAIRENWQTIADLAAAHLATL